MAQAVISVDLTDAIKAGFIAVSLKNSLQLAHSLDLEPLEKWYKSNLPLYNKYKEKCRSANVSIENVRFSGSMKPIMDTYINYNHVKAEVLSVHFSAYAEKALAELDDISDDDVQGFESWFKRNQKIGVAAEFLMSYSGTEQGTIINTARDAAERFHYVADKKDEAIKVRIEEKRIMREQLIKVVQPVEGKYLDSQQLDGIICDADNQLILAGAGTGKTTTIVGKVKYLLRTGKCKPEELLLLSFTRKAADEIRERVESETCCRLDVKTFHKLGTDIITEVNGRCSSIYSKSVREYIKQSIGKHINNPDFKNSFLAYCFFAPPKSITHFDVKSQKEYDEYLEVNPPITIKRETVKGYCEMEIANFLYRNGINYTYEKPYEYDVADKEYAGYHPDFYLNDYGIYIEFYAVDKNGKVPSYFTAKHGGSATSEYRAGMAWKRKIHNEKGTTLVEVSYADKQDNALTERLQTKLEALGVKFTPKTDDELWNEVQRDNSNMLSVVYDVIGTVISLAKSRGYSYDNLRAVNRSPRNIPLLNLVVPIFEDYDKMLAETHQIDFNDMIQIAARYVREGKYVSKYKYVIVDEYQDMAVSRYGLLKELRKCSPYKLFCVGDDWQSIYRFAGSDIGFILNFEKYWGRTVVTKIESTYRFSRNLIAISSRFVMKNPNQTRKLLKTSSQDMSFPLGVIEAYNEENMLRFAEEKICELERNSTVFFIGRYSFDKDMFKYSNFNLEYVKETETCRVTLDSRPDLKMVFLTAHKSKGLQADYVFIINNKKKGLGFPSRIQDDPLIQLLLDGSDIYPFAEERRLFYVAMTRAKKKVWLLLKSRDKSCFAEELCTEYTQYLKPPQVDEQRSQQRNTDWVCPLCGGRLRKRSGQYGAFIGCSNYPACRYTRNMRR